MLDTIKQINILICKIAYLVPASFIYTVEVREHISVTTSAQLTDIIHNIRGWQFYVIFILCL